MCTAIKEDHLFGRTLDLEFSYGEKVVITPGKYPLSFICEGENADHYAIIGTAHIVDSTPLYYDAMNEKGLCAAALRFPKIAEYHEKKPQWHNLASFELIPWLLCNFESADAAKDALKAVNITPDNFSENLPSTPLHWLIADKKQAFVVESVKEGLKIYDDPEGVLTNAPDFPDQRDHLLKRQDLMHSYCRLGEKSLDLPGDSSSRSRFIRAWYAKSHTEPAECHEKSVSRFFHILETVNQPNGFAQTENGKPICTVYTSCMDTESLIYYFTTYSCRQICGVKLKDGYPASNSLALFPMESKENVRFYS